jgi:sugar lactone lactonase YvrE
VVDDGNGNLYVADGDTIRKVVFATGVVTTLAGTAGSPGSADGTGAAASFSSPTGLAYDGTANLYVADTGNDTIRQIVVATGAVTTLAGTAGVPGSQDGSTGAQAGFKSPQGLAYGSGTLYIADTGNDTIRQIVLSSTAVFTLAGTAGKAGSVNGATSVATFNAPQGIAYDGDLYVADTGNELIREIDLLSSVVSTFAGKAGKKGGANASYGSSATFDSPTGLVVDTAGPTALIVTDKANDLIRQIDVKTTAVSTLAGTLTTPGSADGAGAGALFDGPEAVTADGVGNLYVADTLNHTLRQIVAATAEVTTLAGGAAAPGDANDAGIAARFDGPRGLATDGVGNVFVADTANDEIREVAIASGAVSSLAGTATKPGHVNGTGAKASFDGPVGVAYDGNGGNLYVADTANELIRAIVVATGAVTTFAGTAATAGHADGTGTKATFDKPQGVAYDGDAGLLYVADTGNDTIRSIAISTAAVTTLAGTATKSGSADGTGTQASFDGPEGLASDGAGNLFIADTLNDTIRQIVTATGAVTTLAGSPGVAGSSNGLGDKASFNGPQGVAYDGAGNLYVTDSGNSTIRQIVVATGTVTTVVGSAGQSGVAPGPLPASLNGPAGLVFFPPAAALLVSDQIENAILEVK